MGDRIPKELENIRKRSKLGKTRKKLAGPWKAGNQEDRKRGQLSLQPVMKHSSHKTCVRAMYQSKRKPCVLIGIYDNMPCCARTLPLTNECTGLGGRELVTLKPLSAPNT
ncbi:biogenesis of lysosome-related organelles complex 1 subunit 4 [Platysternon megacephalum]|uniref:Biogenesis of lysosome-related organelles complex 1 subunit 4 n=1 Tax=Platysternon megacephalum TaxID=55544 RepID=A0A4D9EAG1_9SAUR|nr:biogenesis of lysosome-related organelles complex 1 subunit 4 [Platysternon megacephalum]